MGLFREKSRMAYDRRVKAIASAVFGLPLQLVIPVLLSRSSLDIVIYQEDLEDAPQTRVLEDFLL